MALSPEKNDVDITALFEYRKPITLYGKGDKVLQICLSSKLYRVSQRNKSRKKKTGKRVSGR